ncbi:hypothetical protein BS47DRAFT_1397321 [Hydnum rufescens UP504]|uniref:Uncharacterized protein n=1 Tax=Hydnum rufescens UP504 TaxID=1448309 RepID=A0A9P6AN66_9AGAM|nr:hypothetical protein BS47DRAFT_1397321 [Hydnum rufescens UP504]
MNDSYQTKAQRAAAGNARNTNPHPPRLSPVRRLETPTPGLRRRNLTPSEPTRDLNALQSSLTSVERCFQSRLRSHRQKCEADTMQMRPPFGIGCGISGQRVWRPAVMDVFSIFIFSSVHSAPQNKVQDLEENRAVLFPIMDVEHTGLNDLSYPVPSVKTTGFIG